MSERNPIPPQLSHLEQMRGAMTRAERDLLLSIGEALTAVLERDSHLITWDRRGMAMSWGEMRCVLESRMKAVKAERGAEQQ